MTVAAVSLSLGYVASQINAAAIGEDVMFSSVSTDTRNINKGDLFVALQGENFDGHDYVDQACKKGAIALMVNRAVSAGVPQIIVDDTRLGLGRLATVWRKQVNPKVVALTGSNGKTTLKEMLSVILSEEHDVLATEGNLNNDIGVPLTLLRLQHEEIAVVEMGANHLGEIDYLSKMVMPDIAILNNAGRAHIGEFGSEENIARGKAEIVNGLKQNGTFIFNADSQWASLWEKLARSFNKVSFGSVSEAQYQLLLDDYHMAWTEKGYESVFSIKENHTAQQYQIRLSLAGLHNCMNAVAAVSASRELGVSIAVIQQALSKLKPVNGRLSSCKGELGQLIIDDTYNANPDSVEAAMEVLITAPGRKIFVLGDLAELGSEAEQMHAEIGRLLQRAGIDALYTCGSVEQNLSQAASAAFDGPSAHFANHQELVAFLQDETGQGDYILVKGSRSALMDRVVAMLMPEGGSC